MDIIGVIIAGIIIGLLGKFFAPGDLTQESDLPALGDIKKRCAEQIDTLWPEVKRFDYPHQYYVDLSPKLMALKDKMLLERGHEIV